MHRALTRVTTPDQFTGHQPHTKRRTHQGFTLVNLLACLGRSASLSRLIHLAFSVQGGDAALIRT